MALPPERELQVEGIVANAVRRMMAEDGHLMEHDCSEMAITHRLALYLEGQFGRGYSVDCEYNRNRHLPKMVRGLAHLRNRRVRPDIIIHGRGDNDHNLVVIEAKKAHKLG